MRRLQKRGAQQRNRQTVRVQSRDAHHSTRRMMSALAVSLGILTSLLILTSYQGQSITGNSVLEGVYGSASPFVLIGVLFLVIMLYTRLVRE